MQLSAKIIFFVIIITIFISCFSRTTYFDIVDSSHSGINFINKTESQPLFNILYYLYYYNGGGVAVGDINNDGLDDIFFTANHLGGNKLYLNQGDFKFKDITVEAGVAGNNHWSTGVTMADVNNDGYLDIYVCVVNKTFGFNGHNELYINNKNNSFTEKSAEYHLNFSGLSTQAAFFDYDHDGDLDCYILNQSSHPHQNVVDTTLRQRFDSIAGDVLLKNELNTQQKFVDVSKQAGIYQSNLGYGLGIAVADFNNDGWEDIYIGNDFHENDYYYVNQKNGKFKEAGAQHFSHYSRFSMGNDAADFDNDQHLDLITVDMLPDREDILKTYGSDESQESFRFKIDFHGYQKQYSHNCLQRNNNNGISFSEIAYFSGVAATDWSWSPLFLDIDNDGKKDLFITSGIVKRPVDLDYVMFVSDLQRNKGMDKTDKYDQQAINEMPDGSSHPYIFIQGSNKKFVSQENDEMSNLKGFYNGSAYSDFNNDGKLDVVINCLEQKALLLKNISTTSNYLTVQLIGNMNTSGIGAKLYTYQKGNVQYLYQSLTRGFQSSSSPQLHFGFPNNQNLDSVVIIWNSGQKQVLTNVSLNQKLVIKETNAQTATNHNELNFSSKYISLANTNIDKLFTHKENDYNDFNIQYLQPHLLSTRGPKTVVGDINNDGLEDIYVCGASNQKGAVLIQQNNGLFKNGTIKYDVARPAITEEVDAVFIDANKDGFLDLYVASGGYEYFDGNLCLNDNFYLNDKQGNFIQQNQTIPIFPKNKSSVCKADFNHDGYDDLFVGVLANIKSYGEPQTSYVLLNNKNGKYEIADSNFINLQRIGMVTAAACADINKDGKTDLIVSGEWMPMIIYYQQENDFIKKEIPNSTGLWQSIFIDDVDQNGQLDIIGGNWGTNSKLYAGKELPLKLYVKDFDKNGSIEQILTYRIKGQEYPFLAKDELERTMPVLKKAYLKYREVAGKNVQYIFYDLFNNYIELKAENLASMQFLQVNSGNFEKKELPSELQYAPMFCFEKISTNTYIAGGNFFGTIPYEGRYDALFPTIITYNKNASYIESLEEIEPSIFGELRDIKKIRIKEKNSLLLVRNNQPLQLYSINKQ